ncbi:MAG: InlB B-repeat-containing protein [Lachnospiraceae bacterium]|nr:InlB B-repeat-containing protein [Lachnospiraceae bacterium]
MVEKRMETMKRTVKKGGAAVVIAAMALFIMAVPAWADGEHTIENTTGDVVWNGGTYTDGRSEKNITGKVTVSADTTLIVHSGVTVIDGMEIEDNVTLTIKGEENASLRILNSISGDGEIIFESGMAIVRGRAGLESCDGEAGVTCDLLVKGGIIEITGGPGGDGEEDDDEGGIGGDGVDADVSVEGGRLIVVGGKGGDGGDDGDGGDGGYGICGEVTVKGGTVKVDGGIGGSGGVRGAAGPGIDGDVFLKGGVLTVTGGKKPNGKNVAAFEDGSELTIEDGYAYYDGTKTYECGEYDNLSGFGGKTLTPLPAAKIGTATYYAMGEVLDKVADGDTIKLLRNLTSESPIEVDAGTAQSPVILDLNGYGIRYTSEPAEYDDGSVIKVLEGKALKIQDTAADSPVYKITLYTNGRGKSVQNVDTAGTDTASEIYVTGGYITGGNGSEDQLGGGVTVEENAIFTLTGGTICGNVALKNVSSSGGVYVNDDAVFTMTGGTIHDNTVRTDGGGGGVYLDEDAIFKVSGSATVRDNMKGTKDNAVKNNVWIYDNKINVTGILTGEFGVSPVTWDDKKNAYVPATGVFTSQLNGRGSDLNFFSDNDDYAVGLNDKKEAVFAGDPVTITFDANGGSGTMSSRKIPKGVKATLSTNTFSAPADTFYNGWNTKADGSGTAYTDKAIVTMNDSQTLYAQWAQYTTAPVAAADLIYDGTEQTGVTDGTGYTLTGNTATNAGYYTARATLKNGYVWDDGTAEAKSIDWCIDSKDVTVTADDKSKTEGEEDPEFTATVTGLVEGESESLISYTFSRILGETVGTYTITPAGKRSQGNYSVTYKEGTLTVLTKQAETGKVPTTGAGETYAAPEDNFAPITGSGKIKEQVLDFSKVAGSGINPEGLKMTAINGSKFTTKGKLRDKDSAKAEGGVKVKVNKKTMIPTITCKKDGSVTLTMEDGVTYKITFKVEKPKPQKDAKKIGIGSGRVTKTIKELFGTDIDAGELEILKQKHSQAALSGNSITVDPAEKDSIKVQYKYLDKKYKIAIKVK